MRLSSFFHTTQNIVILAGNIGQKPEVRSTQSGTKITNFTLATSRPRLSDDPQGDEEPLEWGRAGAQPR